MGCRKKNNSGWCALCFLLAYAAASRGCRLARSDSTTPSPPATLFCNGENNPPVCQGFPKLTSCGAHISFYFSAPMPTANCD